MDMPAVFDRYEAPFINPLHPFELPLLFSIQDKISAGPCAAASAFFVTLVSVSRTSLISAI